MTTIYSIKRNEKFVKQVTENQPIRHCKKEDIGVSYNTGRRYFRGIERLAIVISEHSPERYTEHFAGLVSYRTSFGENGAIKKEFRHLFMIKAINLLFHTDPTWRKKPRNLLLDKA